MLTMFEEEVLIRIFERVRVNITGGWKNLQLHNSYLAKQACYKRDHLKEFEMGEACSSHVRDEICKITHILVGKRKGSGHSGDQCIIVKYELRK